MQYLDPLSPHYVLVTEELGDSFLPDTVELFSKSCAL